MKKIPDNYGWENNGPGPPILEFIFLLLLLTPPIGIMLIIAGVL